MTASLDTERFTELVAYIAWKARDDDRFGRTKMAKTLFYADFGAYAEAGEALTGATYEHWPYGPFPPVLYDIEKRLVADGVAELREGKYEGETAKLVVTTEPTTPNLAAWQKHFIDTKIAELAPLSAKQVSEDSHRHPGWELTGHKEVIPYAAALVPGEPSERAMAVAARRFGLAD